MVEVTDCPEVVERQKGLCWRCGAELPARRQHWCSDACGEWWAANHHWGTARFAAMKRDDYQCVKCGAIGDRPWWFGQQQTMFPVKLEVNHIEPRRGRGYGNGCWNHQSGLETLCHECHLAVTAEQRRT